MQEVSTRGEKNEVRVWIRGDEGLGFGGVRNAWSFCEALIEGNLNDEGGGTERNEIEEDKGVGNEEARWLGERVK